MRVLSLLLLITATVIAAGPAHSNIAARFDKQLADCIGPFWYRSMDQHAQHLGKGTVRVRLTLAADGRLLSTHVLSNTSDALAAQLAVDAIRSAMMPEVPAELLCDGIFEIEYTFELF